MTGNSGKEERRLRPGTLENMENSMISEKPCAGPDVFSWGFSASDKDRFFADFSKNRKTVKKYHT